MLGWLPHMIYSDHTNSRFSYRTAALKLIHSGLGYMRGCILDGIYKAIRWIECAKTIPYLKPVMSSQ